MMIRPTSWHPDILGYSWASRADLPTILSSREPLSQTILSLIWWPTPINKLSSSPTRLHLSLWRANNLTGEGSSPLNVQYLCKCNIGCKSNIIFTAGGQPWDFLNRFLNPIISDESRKWPETYKSDPVPCYSNRQARSYLTITSICNILVVTWYHNGLRWSEIVLMRLYETVWDCMRLYETVWDCMI